MSKANKKDEYPKVKYRIVNGNGYTVCNNEEELKERLKRMTEFYEELKADGDYDIERFRPKYIIKVTEEIIEI